MMKTQFSDYGILYIDDEEKSLKYFEAIFSDLGPIFTAASPDEGYAKFVENHDRIALVLSDKKMPGESGLDLLRRIEAFDPAPFRILVTAFTDLNVAVECLNDGLLYSYLSKPWDPIELEHRLTRALRHFCLTKEREQLLEEKTQMVQQLMMADKASSIGILSRGLNHHLRNSLTVLRSFHDMLPYQLEDEIGGCPKDSEFWTDYYEEVGAQMEKMTGMLSSLAEGSENRAIHSLEEVDFAELVRSTLHLVDDQNANVTFLDPGTEDDITIYGERSALSQMVRMLVQEARRNLAEDGRIEIRVASRSDGEGVSLEVLDDGDLIPEEERKHLFDPFFVRSDKPEELGIGLLACYMTVYRHGGQIQSLSRGECNVIRVDLPERPLREISESEFLYDLSSSRVARSSDTVLPW